MTLLIFGIYIIGFFLFWVKASRAVINDEADADDDIGRMLIIIVTFLFALVWPIFTIVWLMNIYLKENENGS